MKIFLIHGEDELKSYDRLQKFVNTARARSWEVVSVEDSSLSLEETLSARSLFQGERFFILKDIKKLGKKELTWLNKKADKLDGNLVIYHNDALSVAFIKSLPGSPKVEEFKLPKLMFTFLESFYPKNAKRVITLLHESSHSTPPEFLFSLLSKQLRDLYWVKKEAGSLPYPNWRVGKLKNQAERFKIGELMELINDLAEIDIKVKSSNAEIIPSLDLLIATKLE